jgi:hypothetical protein
MKIEHAIVKESFSNEIILSGLNEAALKFLKTE